MVNGHEFLTVKEAAGIVRMHPGSLHRLIKKHPRRAPPFARVGRAIRIPAVKFYEWLERRK